MLEQALEMHEVSILQILLILIIDVLIVIILLFVQALDATASSDKDLQIFELDENEWNTIKEIMSVLKVRNNNFLAIY
jgi:hypothetical protein